MAKMLVSLLLTLFSVIKSQRVYVCVSGFEGQNAGRIVNGEYFSDQNIMNDRYVYERVNDCNPGVHPKLYIFFTGGWYMGPGDPAQNPPYINYDQNNVNQFSVCGGTDSYPYQCTGWTPGVTVENKRCGRSTCQSLTVTGGTSCDGTLDYYEVNNYRKPNTDKDWTLWFDKYFNRWVCTPANDVSNCGASSSEVGVSVQNNFGYVDLTTDPNIQWNTGTQLNPIVGTLGVQCNGYQVSNPPTGASPAPTNKPTPPGTIGSYCLWGHDGGRVFTFVNGLYKYAGELNGHPYYALRNTDDDCPSQYGKYIYLYYVNGINNNEYGNSTWYIGDNLGASWEKLIYGLCRNFNVGSDPRNCDGSWHFGEFATVGGLLTASSATVGYTCPQVPCDAIEWDISNCPGPFTERVYASNDGQEYQSVFRNPSSGYYLYFNENYFGWWCDKPQEFKMRDCDSPIAQNVDKKWYGWSGGQTQTITFNVGVNTQSTTLRCYYGSDAPTKSGNTGSPTMKPSPSPDPTRARVITANPTKTGQTLNPTATRVTADPTQNFVPTRSPIMQPTDAPYTPGSPSNSPSIPTPMPTMKPTNKPGGGGPNPPGPNPPGPTNRPGSAANIINFTFNVFIVFVFSLLLM